MRRIKYKIEWFDAKENPPEEHGVEHSYLICDGDSIAIGWYEPEFHAEDDPEYSERSGITYSSAVWYDDGNTLTACHRGWPNVLYWAYIPELP